MRRTMKYVTSGVAALLAAGALTSAQAATQGPSAASETRGGPATAEKGAARHGKTWVMGNIIEVKKNRLAVNTENGRMRTFALTKKTAIVVDGKRATAADLKPGAPVMAAYEGTGAHAKAIRVEVDESRRAK